jgi:hypothetical protein
MKNIIIPDEYQKKEYIAALETFISAGDSKEEVIRKAKEDGHKHFYVFKVTKADGGRAFETVVTEYAPPIATNNFFSD